MSKTQKNSLNLKLYNKLPSHIKSLNDHQFKKQIKNYMLQHCLYTTDEFLNSTHPIQRNLFLFKIIIGVPAFWIYYHVCHLTNPMFLFTYFCITSLLLLCSPVSRNILLLLIRMQLHVFLFIYFMFLFLFLYEPQCAYIHCIFLDLLQMYFLHKVVK